MHKLLAILCLIAAFTTACTNTEENFYDDTSNYDTSNIMSYYEEASSELPDHTSVCFPEYKYFCTQTGCESIEPTVFNLIYAEISISGLIDMSEISRCDTQGCDTYGAEIETSGLQQEVRTISPHGMLFKRDMSNDNYIEVVTLGIDSYLTYGSCFDVDKRKSIEEFLTPL